MRELVICVFFSSVKNVMQCLAHFPKCQKSVKAFHSQLSVGAYVFIFYNVYFCNDALHLALVFDVIMSVLFLSVFCPLIFREMVICAPCSCVCTT